MGIIKNIFNKSEDTKKQVETKPEVVVKKENPDDLSAIIAATIHLYLQEVHDFQNYSLTIKRIDKIYSPWSSKIYGLRKWPR
jgi:glutaconyl-CoA/methylmalonyl-CoA decarboxylase subunit delta